jgi:hypothetical protein
MPRGSQGTLVADPTGAPASGQSIHSDVIRAGSSRVTAACTAKNAASQGSQSGDSCVPS